jgi:hypothetical protein
VSGFLKVVVKGVERCPVYIFSLFLFSCLLVQSLLDFCIVGRCWDLLIVIVGSIIVERGLRGLYISKGYKGVVMDIAIVNELIIAGVRSRRLALYTK